MEQINPQIPAEAIDEAIRKITRPESPTIVVITDRNDLDNQLFGTFSRCKDLLRQTPQQAENKDHLKALLQTGSRGVIFTTIQKFQPDNKLEPYPELSTRENIIVIADEAHRSQYDFIDGFARHMHDALPNASFIGFTGTPIETGDRNTRQVFGDYIDTYDILRSVTDKMTVPILYESRLAKLELLESEKPKIDPEFEEITEDAEETAKSKLQTKWARLEAMVGTRKRIDLIADDFVRHFEQRLEGMEGKAMIVCMSRRICVDMYHAIVKLRPQWHSHDNTKGTIKVVMTGSASDESTWQPHIRPKTERDDLANRYKDPTDPFKIVIVRDMWLTGFDCPSMHTMYIDKPMRGHGLMQAIARVNRVFKDKPGGLVVDYIGLGDQLREAVYEYSQADGKGELAQSIEDVIPKLKEKYEIVLNILDGFEYLPYVTTTDWAKRLHGIQAGLDFVLDIDDGKKRFLDAVTQLSRAFALSVPHPYTREIRDDVGFFQEIRTGLAKFTVEGAEQSHEEMDTAIRQLVSRAVTSEKVIDIFVELGKGKPDLSILSEQFLAELRGTEHKNLAVEALRKLINDEIKTRSKRNIVQARSFKEKLEEAILKYHNRAIETVQVIEELIGLAKDMGEAKRRGEQTGLTEDEIAFYDALEVNDSAVQVLGDATLKTIARELVKAVKNSVTIDWKIRDNARAQIRVYVKRILRRYGYPPDKQEKATDTVLEQAEELCKTWVEEI